MRFPESWLRAFCNPPLSTEQLANALTMAGLEVEAVEPVSPPFSGVVVGKILRVNQHPDADRLRVCWVDVGLEQPLQIVCGAANAREGIWVPCARVGAQLPPGQDGKPFLIRSSKLRGVSSEGMLCSAQELCVLTAGEGLLELPADAVVGRDVREQLKLDEMILTLKLTPNLGHCLSIYGVARELAAITGTPLHEPVFVPAPVHVAQAWPVQVQAADLCTRFAARVVRGVNASAPTPAWMVERLERCGQRSISALVDISNYVMFELGRPSHMFDLDKIEGPLEVRWARAGEQVVLLNGQTVALDGTVGVVADAHSVLSLAGIMGGQATAVSEQTRNVLIEAAFWWPKAIAGRARRFNLSSEAAHRFERGVDPASIGPHMERITQLVLEICGGQASAVSDTSLAFEEPKPVTLRIARTQKVLGMPLTLEQCSEVLRRLGLEVTQGQGCLSALVPSYRFDLQIEEDLIEEIARVIGYEQIPHTPARGVMRAMYKPEALRPVAVLRRELAHMGYQETVNFSFVDECWERELAGNEDPIKLLNPIVSHLGVMRSSLLGSLLAVLKFNLDRRAPRVRVFEIGRVFMKDSTVQDSYSTVRGFDQPMRVAGLCAGSVEVLQWGVAEREVDFFDVKGDVQALLAPLPVTFRASPHPAMHPGRAASVWLQGRCIGSVGELHPKWRQAYEIAQSALMFELDLDVVLQRVVPAYKRVSRSQAVERDLAIVVNESVPHDAVVSAIEAATVPWLRDVVVFDVYRPAKKALVESLQASPAPVAQDEKSLTVRLVLHGDDVTLTEAQIDSSVQAVLSCLAQTVAARLRA